MGALFYHFVEERPEGSTRAVFVPTQNLYRVVNCHLFFVWFVFFVCTLAFGSAPDVQSPATKSTSREHVDLKKRKHLLKLKSNLSSFCTR